MSGSDIVTGTLELLILKTLDGGALHGYAIGKAIKGRSSDILRIGENILYPALHRLEARKDLNCAWGVTSTGREAKIYRITPKGRRRLAKESERWMARSQAAFLILSGNDAG